MLSYTHRKEVKWILLGGVIGYLLCRFDGVFMAMELLRSFL